MAQGKHHSVDHEAHLMGLEREPLQTPKRASTWPSAGLQRVMGGALALWCHQARAHCRRTLQVGCLLGTTS